MELNTRGNTQLYPTEKVSSQHRLPKLKSRLFDVFLRALRAADSTYVVYATACVYREMYGKITESLKSGK